MAAFEQYPLHFSSDNGTSPTDELSFQLSETTPATSMMVTNINTWNFAFAVQACSSNTHSYCVDPCYGIIGPGDRARLVFSINDTQQLAILANLECSDQLAVVSILIPDDLAEFIASKQPLERRTHILQLCGSEQLAKYTKYLSVCIDVAQAPPLQAAKKPRLALTSTIGDDSSSSSEEEGDNNRSRINWEGTWDLRSVRAVEALGVERLRELCGDQGLPVQKGGRAAKEMAKRLFEHMRSRPMPGAPVAPIDPNNVSQINYTGIWSLPSAKRIEALGVPRLQKLCEDRDLTALKGDGAARKMSKALFEHFKTHTMPVYKAPPPVPRPQRVLKKSAQVAARISKVVVQHSGDTLTLGRAFIPTANPRQRIQTIQGFAEQVQRIRREATGLDETPDSDAEGLDTQGEVMLATRHAGPLIVTAAVGGIGKKPLTDLCLHVHKVLESGGPLFSKELPSGYTEALGGHRDIAPRGDRGGFRVGYVSHESLAETAESRRTGAIVEYDASQVTQLIRYARRLLRDAQDPTKETTVENDRRGALLLRFLVVANRDDSDAAGKFTVVPATPDQVRDKIRAMEAEVAKDGQTLELLTPKEYLNSQYHKLWLTDTSKTDSTGQPITNNGVYAVSYDAYGPQRLGILLRDLQFAFEMDQVTVAFEMDRVTDQGAQDRDEFTETRKWVRKLIVRNVFAGKKPWEMDGVAQTWRNKMERTMIINYNMMIHFKAPNTRFKRRHTSHRLSLVQNGDCLTSYSRGTDHAYNWLKPYWLQGTADDPELPRTFMSEQA